MNIYYEKILKTVTCNGMRELTEARVLQAMQEAVQQSQRWIPVSEKPKNGKEYFVLFDDMGVMIVKYENDWWGFGNNRITHWQPLPGHNHIQTVEEENDRLRAREREIAGEAWEAATKRMLQETSFLKAYITAPDKETYLNQTF